MTATPKTLDVSIMGREYRVACPPNQEKELLEAVVYLDRKMREIREHGKVVGVERIAVMAALNIAHELLMTRAGGAFDIPGFKRRIETMQAAIDGALAEEEKQHF
jgi:cell division protein ZapA